MTYTIYSVLMSMFVTDMVHIQKTLITLHWTHMVHMFEQSHAVPAASQS